MPRKNSPSRGRRRQPPPEAKPIAEGCEGLARALVAAGLCTVGILDQPPLSTSNDRTGRRNHS
jgi:hypothetical protein